MKSSLARVPRDYWYSNSYWILQSLSCRTANIIFSTWNALNLNSQSLQHGSRWFDLFFFYSTDQKSVGRDVLFEINNLVKNWKDIAIEAGIRDLMSSLCSYCCLPLCTAVHDMPTCSFKEKVQFQLSLSKQNIQQLQWGFWWASKVWSGSLLFMAYSAI